MIFLLTGPSLRGSQGVRNFRQLTNGDVEQSEEHNRANVRRLIEGESGQEPFHDEPEQSETSRAIEASSGNDQNRGLRVVPSPLFSI